MWFLCCLHPLTRSAFVKNKHALHCEFTAARLSRGKDESRIVISIDFKTDLIDLFKGNKKARNGSKFDKGIPKQFLLSWNF